MARQSVPAGVFGSLEQIVYSTPTDIRQKLQTDATLNAGEGEMDEYFANSVKGKPAQLHLKIDKANPRAPGENKFLVHVLDHEETTWNGVRLSAWLWVKFSKEDMPPDAKLAEGSEITVSGVITRCEVGRAGRLKTVRAYCASSLEVMQAVVSNIPVFSSEWHGSPAMEESCSPTSTSLPIRVSSRPVLWKYADLKCGVASASAPQSVANS